MEKEFKITKEKILAMASECSEAKAVLKKGFPEAFEDEWTDITRQVRFIPDSRQGKGFYWIGMYEEGALDHFGYIDISRGVDICDCDKNRYRVETGKGENGCTYFRILKRNKED